jgi:hypothetical protein
MKITQTILTGIATFALIVTFQSTASALSVNVSRTEGAYPYRSGGGEFTLKSDTLSNAGYNAKTRVGDGFQTFCVEFDAPIGDTVGSYNYRYEISDRAKGPEQPAGFDRISLGTAWLYSQFATGLLSGYDYEYGPKRKQSALALQDAIWQLEDEANGLPYAVPNNIFLQAVQGHFGSLLNAKGHANGAYNVFVLNLFEDGTKGVRQIQDQLYYKPGVPDGGSTAILLSSALGAMAWFRRRRVS